MLDAEEQRMSQTEDDLPTSRRHPSMNRKIRILSSQIALMSCSAGLYLSYRLYSLQYLPSLFMGAGGQGLRNPLVYLLPTLLAAAGLVVHLRSQEQPEKGLQANLTVLGFLLLGMVLVLEIFYDVLHSSS